MTDKERVLPMKSGNDKDDGSITVMFTDVQGCSSNVITCCTCVINSDNIPVLYDPDMHCYFYV